MTKRAKPRKPRVRKPRPFRFTRLSEEYAWVGEHSVTTKWDAIFTLRNAKRYIKWMAHAAAWLEQREGER